MLTTLLLTEHQVGDFHGDGYVIVRSAFDDGEMRQIEAWTRELAERCCQPNANSLQSTRSRDARAAG